MEIIYIENYLQFSVGLKIFGFRFKILLQKYYLLRKIFHILTDNGGIF